MRELLFYGFIGTFSVREFIQQLTAIAGTNEGAFLKVNSSGGDVDKGWGAVAEWRAFKGQKKILVHGAAHSMMAIILLFAEDVTAIEQSKFLLHRASSFFEEDNETAKRLVDETNKDIRKAFEDKLDIEGFERIGREQHGVLFSLEAFFSSSQPVIDVILNSAQAKDIGLIKNVVSLNANEAEDINQSLLAASSGKGVQMLTVEKIKDKNRETQKTKAMTKEEIKEKYPEAFKAIQADASTTPSIPTPSKSPSPQPTDVEAAITAERDRVAAWNAWADVDLKAVQEGIESGEAISTAQTQKFIAASVKKASLLEEERDSPQAIITPKTKGVKGGEDEKKQEEIAAFEAELRAECGLSVAS